MEKYDEVNHPKHYVENRFWIEPHVVFRFLAYPQGNALKYILRAGKKLYPGKTEKESKLLDLKKAAWYLNDREEMWLIDGRLFRLFCENIDNDLIRAAYYPGVELNDEAPHDDPGDRPKTFWQNLETVVNFEIKRLERK